MSDEPRPTQPAAPARRRARRVRAGDAPVAAFPSLPAELTIYTAAETHRQWMQWWAQRDPATHDVVSVDAAALGSIDAAGLQLLVSLRRLLAQRGAELRLTRPSEVLRAASAAMGVPALVPSEAA